MEFMGWNKALEEKGPDRSSKSWDCHQPRQDKGHENREMAGNRQDCDRRGTPINEVEDFCHLGSMMSSNSSCNKETKTRVCKANAVFGRLEKIWKSSGCSVDTKVQLSTLLYGAET